MPKLRVSASAANDLRKLSRDEFDVAWGIIDHLKKNPGEGEVVSPLQFQLDPSLSPPCTFFERPVGPGRRVIVFFEVQSGELQVFRAIRYFQL